MENSWEEGQNILSNSIACFANKASRWNRETFGNVFQRKRRVLARLGGIQRNLAERPSDFLVQLEKSLGEEYRLILRDERELCLLKSRTDWLLEGETNTKFFHVSTLINWHFNKISGFKDESGNWSFDSRSLSLMVQDYFQKLFYIIYSIG